MRIVFHGNTAKAFSDGFVDLLTFPVEIVSVPEVVNDPHQRAVFEAADVIVTPRLGQDMPRPNSTRLFQCPGAGYDGIDVSLLPTKATLCNCFEHEDAIAEYLMTAILMFHVPIVDADHRLREGEWYPHWAGNPEGLHDELAGKTLTLVGFGHIGKALVLRARAFGLRIQVVNRTPPGPEHAIDEAFGLDQLSAALARADIVVISLALTEATRSIIGAEAFLAMKPGVFLINVARGPVVDEYALFEALSQRRIGGAVIDTWYNYPRPGTRNGRPSDLPFEKLSNLIMTPHMSGWTRGTIARRRRFIAGNIGRLNNGEPLLNVIRSGTSY